MRKGSSSGRIRSGSLTSISTNSTTFLLTPSKDDSHPASIDLLKRAGISFDKLKRQGIELEDFAEYFMGSGLVCNNEIHWVVFHGSFDFGYLLKVVTSQKLPERSEQFF